MSSSITRRQTRLVLLSCSFFMVRFFVCLNELCELNVDGFLIGKLDVSYLLPKCTKKIGPSFFAQSGQFLQANMKHLLLLAFALAHTVHSSQKVDYAFLKNQCISYLGICSKAFCGYG